MVSGSEAARPDTGQLERHETVPAIAMPHTGSHGEIDDDRFKALCLDDCFHRKGGVAQWLRDPERVERFHDLLKLTSKDLHLQIERYQDNVKRGGPTNASWLFRIRKVKRNVDRRLLELSPLVKARRSTPVRTHEMSALLSDLRATRRAIHEHREAVLQGDYVPTDADLALWSVVA